MHKADRPDNEGRVVSAPPIECLLYGTASCMSCRTAPTPLNGSQRTTNMKASRLTTVIENLLDQPWAAFIWGAPGIGKSSIVRQIAERRRMPLIDIRLPARSDRPARHSDDPGRHGRLVPAVLPAEEVRQARHSLPRRDQRRASSRAGRALSAHSRPQGRRIRTSRRLAHHCGRQSPRGQGGDLQALERARQPLHPPQS